ncbi:peroxidase 40 [Impatiens glandulifera]|uniref:peroxidase 40 n=1 Tax=Impatiens glandulifera TaxID=253017 RepID=UPI001FB09B6F|nr:peroxidase 40 [Impatiens glandulifera]
MAFYLAISLIMFGLLIRSNVATTNSSFSKDCLGTDGNSVLKVGFYRESCPDIEAIIFSWVGKAVLDDPRMAASLLRLHFHDCFVNGCDASVLLDDTTSFQGEKTAGPNVNSLRGFEIIDVIKSELEYLCPETVSCADILAIAARDSIVLSGGPWWEVQVGRRDSLTASMADANNNIPGPNSDVAALMAKFQNVGLTLVDMVTLSGAHTMGKARCFTFSSRLLGNGILPNTNENFMQILQQLCAADPNSNTTLANLDTTTPTTFDNQYYINLLSGEGLLQSDQALIVSDQTRETVEAYANDPLAFYEGFKQSMIKMGGLAPRTINSGEIRRNCRNPN